MNRTKILWPWNPLHTVNPFVGCSKVSEGCANCYAEKMAYRLAEIDEAAWKMCNRSMRYVRSDYSDVIGEDGKWNGETVFRPQVLDAVRKARKLRNIFWCSMSDLFHENNPMSNIYETLHTIRNAPQHTHIILTKRPRRMAMFLAENANWKARYNTPNIWLGVTAENQGCASKRIPRLLSITGEHKTFVSVEPMLGEVSLACYYGPSVISGLWFERDFLRGATRNIGVPKSREFRTTGERHLDQVIIGAESGAGARPMNPEWVIDLVKQCRDANVPVFVKQFCKNGRAIPFEKWPKEMQVREVAE